MGQRFQVKPVKKYKAGYPKKGFFRRSFVCAVPLKRFSFFIIGLLFFITVPGCNEEELSGVTVPDHDTEITDTETGDEDVECASNEDCEEGYYCDKSSFTCVLEELEGVDEVEILPEEDVETNDFDELDGLAQPECMKDEDCEEGYYCDLNSYTCEMELAGEPVAECYQDEDCAEGFYCDQTTFTCEEEMLGDPVPDQMPDEDINDAEEVPDDMMGFAPPEIK